MRRLGNFPQSCGVWGNCLPVCRETIIHYLNLAGFDKIEVNWASAKPLNIFHVHVITVQGEFECLSGTTSSDSANDQVDYNCVKVLPF